LEWHRLDTADTSSVYNTDSDVSRLSPFGGPGVLDNPEGLSCFSSVTNNKYGVIKGCSTCGSISNNTSGILMEDWLVSFNSDRNWSNLEGSIESIDVTGSDFGPGLNLDNSLCSIVLAFEKS